MEAAAFPQQNRLQPFGRTSKIGGMSLIGDIALRERLREGAPGLLIVLTIGIFYLFGYLGIWHRLQIDVEGKITARQDFAQTPYTHGPTTLYKLQQGDGSIRNYTATAAGASPSRNGRGNCPTS
jgi:hypothetical protein